MPFHEVTRNSSCPYTGGEAAESLHPESRGAVADLRVREGLQRPALPRAPLLRLAGPGPRGGGEAPEQSMRLVPVPPQIRGARAGRICDVWGGGLAGSQNLVPVAWLGRVFWAVFARQVAASRSRQVCEEVKHADTNLREDPRPMAGTRRKRRLLLGG